ncbi:hypothetical protein HMPREF9998_01287, partial [Peptostreptococcus anaerobius VPI 4330 = DSM 2949]
FTADLKIFGGGFKVDRVDEKTKGRPRKSKPKPDESGDKTECEQSESQCI